MATKRTLGMLSPLLVSSLQETVIAGPGAAQSLGEYVESSRERVSRMAAAASRQETHLEGRTLMEISSELGDLACSADAWGFAEIERLASGMRQFVLRMSCGRVATDSRSARLLLNGLDLIADLLGDCEREIARKSAVGEMIEAYSNAARV